MPIVIDEVSDLLPLYGLAQTEPKQFTLPTPDQNENPRRVEQADLQDTLDGARDRTKNGEQTTSTRFDAHMELHLRRYGRIGFSTEGNGCRTAREEIRYHFTRTTPELLEREERFIRRLLQSDLKSIVESGYAQSREVLPDREYIDPTLVLLLSGRKTDARVIAKSAFGINLTNLFSHICIESSDAENDLLIGRKRLQSIAAHESNHTYVHQLHLPRDTHPIFLAAFYEGLATKAETIHFPWHDEYFHAAERWIDLGVRAEQAQSEEDRRSVILEISQDQAFRHHRRRDADRFASRAKAPEPIDDREFHALKQQMFIEWNGPAYHMGHYIWERIEQEDRREGLKRIVQQGPGAFTQRFYEIRTRQ